MHCHSTALPHCHYLLDNWKYQFSLSAQPVGVHCLQECNLYWRVSKRAFICKLTGKPDLKCCKKHIWSRIEALSIKLCCVAKFTMFAWQIQTEAGRIQTRKVRLYGCEPGTKTRTKYHNLAQLPQQVSETAMSWDNFKLANIDVLDGWEVGTQHLV